MFDPLGFDYEDDEDAGRFQLDGDINDDVALAFFAEENVFPWLDNQPNNGGDQEDCVA